MHDWVSGLARLHGALSLCAGTLVIAGFIPYILAILRRATEPAKASWVIWATLDWITFAGMVAKGTVNGQMIGAVIGVSITVVLVLKLGKPGWTLLDKTCLGGAVLGVALWAITANPVMGIATSCIVILLGSIPTFVSTWEDPSHENGLAWTLYWFSCLFTIAAIPSWTPAATLQPITITVVESIKIVLPFVRPRQRAHA